MSLNGDVAESSKRVIVSFVTKLKPPLRVPASKLAIPSDLTRKGLSDIVNELLKAGNSEWEPQPFDFLIDGELVRMPLDQFLLAKGISAEKTLEIEYIRLAAPRKKEESCLHDDWVSAVDGSDPRFVITGSYDNFARVWKAGRSYTHILDGHSDAVTSVTIVNKKGTEDVNNLCVATASKDRTLRLWKFDVDEIRDHPRKIIAFKILNGHKQSVQSVAAQMSGDMVCSGSWDCTINLWHTNEYDAEGDLVSIKKRKVGTKREELQSEEEAVSTLVGHKQCVSSVVWPERETIYSASWDHSVKKWDLETGKSMDILCGKALNCVDVGGESSSLIAAGGTDPVISIWDPRKPGSSAPIYQFSSHKSWISACKWHKKSWFHLVSASYDGKLMLWDLRTAWPVATLNSHNDKVLCADWWKGDSVVSGGADSKLCISSEIPFD